MFVTKNGSFLLLLPIVVSSSAIVLISPAAFPELSILKRGIGEGRAIVFILFSLIKLPCTKEEEAPESIIAFTEIVLECPWNIRGILRCCPFAPKMIAEEDEESEKEEEEMIEEKRFERNWSE
jgi:hypothetical protein